MVSVQANYQKQTQESKTKQIEFLNALKKSRKLNSENFVRELKKSADRTDCKFLCELPTTLLNIRNGIAAAIVYYENEQANLFFVTKAGPRSNPKTLHPEKAPQHLVDIAWSYANVLSMLSNIDLNASKQSLQ